VDAVIDPIKAGGEIAKAKITGVFKECFFIRGAAENKTQRA